MTEIKGFDTLDVISVLIKAKRSILYLTISIGVISYFCIYFFVSEQFEATSIVLPSEQDQLSTLNSIMKNFSGLTGSIGAGKKATATDLYKTVLYSRTNLDKIISKFDLYKEYDLNSYERTRDLLKANIKSGETEEKAFFVTIRASSRQKCADMTNYAIKLLNETIIELNKQKASENKNFIENRYNNIKTELKSYEDSLNQFQRINNVFELEAQLKSTFELYAKLDAEIAQKETQISVLEQIDDKNTPILEQYKTGLEQYRKKVNEIKAGGNGTKSILLPFTNIADKSLEYYRLYRSVKIQQSLLEFIVPVYEQAKLEEQKSIPVLHVIDEAVPPEKRVFPKRTFLALGITGSVLAFYILSLFLKFWYLNTSDNRISSIKKLFNR